MQFDSVPVTRAEQNCSILWCPATHAAAVIDPGGDLDRIECFLEWEGLLRSGMDDDPPFVFSRVEHVIL
jgi:hydroxyacylglutathione hydrolase